MSEKPDYRDTVFLPKTDFPMKAGLAQKEPAILARWTQEQLYERLRDARKDRKRFILHDGPPYANGDIHMGHAMNKILKDIIVRSATLRGFDAPYIPGWDCHGLPIEWKVEEEYRKKKLDKDEVPVARFRAECRAYADKWVGVQMEQFQRLGVMGEWDDPYLTMKYEAEATIAGELLKFAESGQLYRGAKPVMWSPVEKTALADAEVEYEDITSTQIDVAFEIVESPIPELVGAHAVVWTTTPWTIPVNQAIAYGPEVEYEVLHVREKDLPPDGSRSWMAGKRYLVATDLVGAFHKRSGIVLADDWDDEYTGFKGSDLAGTVARHPMHHLGGFFAKARPFLPGEFVTTDAGTGLVHMSPDHGEDDFELCKAHGIDPVFAVEGDGKYRADWLWLGGQGSVINTKFNAPDGPICTDLREVGGLLAASADFRHSYPHSWRSKAKVIFRCTPQWFIPMDKPAPSPLRGEGWGEGERAAGERPASELNLDPQNPLTQPPPPGGEGFTLRKTALKAIDDTRWVPEKSRNRIRSMVEGRPDWVISRQRAWGVPIALYLHKQTGAYLRDADVNARIVAAFREGGADAWFQADHQALLGNGYKLDEYEPQNDILDVWFDSGSTHAYVIEARYGTGARADLYLEGSDQHRGWFQSSLLESSGTRGVAPYHGVLTHGFALDGQGRKMSKSVGNVVDPLAIIRDNGADILRLWVASTDYFEDVRIGKEVLAGTSDAYRKLRNTFRYLLGALDGYTDAEAVPVAEMPELERWVLHRLTMLDAELKEAAEGYEFNRYTRALQAFANDDLSAFFFDIRKDSLYCDVGPKLPEGTLKRRAYRTVLHHVFEALVRWVNPILCFTAEEVWQARYPAGGSVHMLDWPEVDAGWRDEALAAKWDRIRSSRVRVTEAIEPLRREKVIGSSLEAQVSYPGLERDVPDADLAELTEIYIVSEVTNGSGDTIAVTPTENNKCGRCWRYLPEVEEDGDLCKRCDEVVNG
ncbi:isoleucine--tRNA ligase [Sphingosinicella sp. LHD-64]|uniref:isoleucine--tRNA ligase n=1 Tax=Sphingosinicella sp. LHD-64 TaxID=3072139 RepID=UPI00280F000C|nr:isoleucine--tRNA ligase [Sphingosinicella sp. LHD-64]MDQ8755688.1 isoleucine--tRNA ligase [Sphingosinicella sp. LHD-64]